MTFLKRKNRLICARVTAKNNNDEKNSIRQNKFENKLKLW